MMTLDWRSIRSLNEAQYNGFEELCAQLARDITPEGAKFVRNGTPDGGVECFIVLPSDDEWGWQSKYVFSADESQWSQMDDSVNTALRVHPRLVRYYVCLPIDLPDARIGKKRSARDKWNAHHTKWNGWAAARQMSVDFILWDSSYLLNLLSLPKHAGRVMFWFGSPGCFDGDWFTNQIGMALKSASPRYTPELHVNLPISESFEAFGRTQAMVSRVRRTGASIQNHFRWVIGWSDDGEKAGLGAATQPLKAAVNHQGKRIKI